MGLGAVSSAFREAHRLGDKHAAVRLLLWMAFNASDQPRGDKEPLTFYGGYRTAASGLGYTLAELDDPDRDRAALTAVKRTLRALEQAGLIERVRRSAPGKTAEWRLTLDSAEPVDNSRSRSNRGGRRPTGTGVEDRSDGGRRPTGTGVEELTLRGRSSTPPSVDLLDLTDLNTSVRARARA